MANVCESNCDRLDVSDVFTAHEEGPPPTTAQLDMAAKIESILDHNFKVVCLPSTTCALKRLESKTSFGVNKYKPNRSPLGTPKPNCYRVTNFEGNMVGFAPFHAFDVTIYPPIDPLYPNGTANVVGDYPHRGPLCGLAKFIAFCEVGPRTEQRLVLLQEDTGRYR